jgi:hypothetical protein
MKEGHILGRIPVGGHAPLRSALTPAAALRVLCLAEGQ